MGIDQLGLTKGKWLVADCGKFPSEKGCRLVIMAPASQKEDLIDAAATHAVESHGHDRGPSLRKDVADFLVAIDV